MSIELYDHQKKAVEKLSSGKILCGGVGSGKTLTALAYYKKYESDKRLLVITTAKKRDSGDWNDEAALLNLKEPVVDSWQNIHKYEDWENVFAIFDEQRLVGSGKWVKAFIKIAKRNRWILLTATPGDTWLDYIPVFVANGFYKNRTEFKQEHVVYNTYSKFPKVDRYISVGRLVKHRNSLLVKMEFDRHTKRHLKDVLVDYDVELFKKVMEKRWHVYEERPLRDVAEMFAVMRKVVNSDTSRLQHLQELLRQHPKVIVFYNFDYELEILRSLARDETETSASPKDATEKPALKVFEESALTTPTDQSERCGHTSADLKNPCTCKTNPSVSVAEWNGHKHEPIPDSERWVYLVQYHAGAEAWNCIETNVMVFWSLTYSYKMFEQAQGRIDRMNTPFSNLEYYIFRSKSFIDSAILRSLTAKKSFNEAKFAEKHLKT